MADLGADVVGVLESYNRLPEIAAAAGYPYYDVGLQILSKYPILEPSGADGLYAYIEVRPGEAVAMINTHLDYVQDGPNRLNRGVPVADVLATEKQVRLSSIETLLPSATSLLDKGWPVLLTGDLNEPSHLDGPVAWPVSEALVGAGLHDSYREAHPDAATDPGNTWGGVAGSKGSPRRIDYAYVGGPVKVVSSEVVGERGGDSVDRGYPKWTSDHRAVLSQLDGHSGPHPDHRRPVEPHGHGRRRGDRSYRMPDGSDSGRSRSTGPSIRVVRRDRRVGHVEGGRRTSSPRGLPGRPVGRRTTSSPPTSSTCDPKAAKVDLTTDASTYAVGRPDHRALGRRPGQPLGLDRRLPRRRRQPGEGQLPRLGLHRRPRRRRAAAEHRGRAGPRPRPPGQALAAAAGPLRRPLPAHRPVQQRGIDQLHRALTELSSAVTRGYHRGSCRTARTQ